MHEGHRERLREKAMKNGLESLHEHEYFELLLSYAIPRKNTNNIAHELMNKFGSVSAVFDAPMRALQNVPGIGTTSALLLKLIPEITRIYFEDKNNPKIKFVDNQNAPEILKNKFLGRINEVIVLMLMDSKDKLLFCDVISEGSVNSSDIYVRDIMSRCLEHNATNAIIAHNHPSGMALPSRADLDTTVALVQTLRMINVTLLDHYIYADGECISIAQSGLGQAIFG